MAIINTTDVVDSAIFLKAKTPKNMVSDNYYILNLQDKLDKEWEYRSNVIDIEEELNRQLTYTTADPTYTPYEAVLQKVHTVKGEKVGDDWKNLVFRDIKHPVALGKRYRFSTEYDKTLTYTEQEKKQKSSIWLGVNFDTAVPTSSMVVRRCNSNIVFGGSSSMDYANITETHQEPCILETNFKSISLYTDLIITLSQAEIYVIMQYNYFTKGIGVNDRVFIGDVDTERRENNYVFKVKAVDKFNNKTTFSVGVNQENSTNTIVILALDKDVLNEGDNVTQRLAVHPPLYKIPTTPTVTPEPTPSPSPTPAPEEPTSEHGYRIVLDADWETENVILYQETVKIKCELYYGSERQNTAFVVEHTLPKIKNQTNYYELSQANNEVSITNLKACLSSKLKVDFSCPTPEGDIITESRLIKLGGYY